VSENVHLHVGFFGESLPPFLKKHTDPIRFLHVDCDLFSSTKTILSLLRSRIVPGTVIVFDEFFGYSKWREDEYKAFQEAVANFGWRHDYLAVSLFSKQAVIIIR
jgi:predicted O-methyltransferase YrrM